MARSLNKVELIGNITKDVELKYTPTGAAVCSFSIATNRQWTTDSGEKKEDAEFHRIVAWNKLAELCGQLLAKGRKVYVEGRLQTRKWTGQDGVDKYMTEVIINDMIILDSRGSGGTTGGDDYGVSDKDLSDIPVYDENKTKVEPKVTAKEENVTSEATDDDIPF